MRNTSCPSRRPLTSSLSKLPSAAAICAVLALASASSASAATYYWDADGDVTGNVIGTGVNLGGAGTWTVPTGLNWFNGTADVAWPNTDPNADTAVFTGTGGVVQLGSPVFVNTLQFNTTGYSITNGGVPANVLTLSGTLPTISVLNAGDNAAITAVIAGTNGLVKTGAGTLTLSAGNTFTGNVLIQGGTLAFNGVAASNDQTAFGPGAKTITLTNNATLALVGANDADPNVAGGKGFVIGTGGGTIDVAAGRTFFLNDGVSNGSFQNQLQGSGTLTKTGPGALRVGLDYTATFSGDVKLNEGRLDYAATGAFGNVGTITVTGSPGGTRLNIGSPSTTAVTITNNIVLKDGAVMSTQGAGQNLRNDRSLTIDAGTARFRADDAAAATPSATNRTTVLNGALNGTGTLEVAGPTGTARGVLALSNAAGNFAGTIVIDRNVSVENFARWNGTTAANTGKTIGTALIKFQNLAGGATSTGSSTTLDGQLDLRDSGTGNNQVFNYGNNVDMTDAGGIIAVGTNTSQTFASTGGRFVLGTLSLGAGKTITANSSNGYSLEFGGVTTLAGDATFAGTSDLTLTGGITGGNNIVKTSTGRLTIGAPAGATYTGTTAINAGGIVFNSASAIGGTGATVTLANGTYIGANFAATQANLIDRIVPNANTSVIALGADTSANLNLTGLTGARLGAIGTAVYSGTLTQAGSTVLLGGGGGTLVFTNNNVVTGTQSLDVGSSGTPAGIVAFDGTNDFTGAITLSGGQLLRIASNASLGNAANVITANGGGIQFKNAAAGYDIFATRTINFTGGFILDTNGYDYTPTVAIGNGGAGSFTKAGAGKLTINQAVTYTGKTIVTGGTLSVSADNQLGTVPAAVTQDQLQIQGGGTLELNGTFTIPVQRGVQFSNGGGAISVTSGNTVTLASSTTGSAQFTKNGDGTLLITADPNNNNTTGVGGFTINAGVLALQHSGSTDAPFVINNTGTLRVLTANDLGDSYSVTVNAGGTFDLRASDQISQLFGTGIVKNDGAAGATLTVNSAANATFAGSIQNGVSAIGFAKGGANTVTFTGANTYTGGTSISTGLLSIEGAAGALGNTAITVGDNNGGDEILNFGQVTDIWNSGDLNRLGDTGSINMNGRVRVVYNGPAAGSTGFTETLGTITTGAGANVFTVNPGNGAEVQLSPAALARANSGTVLFRGNNLGGTGVGSARIVPTSVSLVGGGGAAGSTELSILPYAIGDSSATGAGSSFLTSGPNGLRPLTNAEYDSTIAGAGTARNVSLAGGENVTAGAAVNSIRVTGGTTTIAAGTTVANGSGAVLFTGAGEIAGPGTIAFGSSDAIISVAQNSTAITGAVNANITSASGITVGSFGFDAAGGFLNNTVVLGGTNSVVGNVTVNNGTLRLGSSGAVGSTSAPTALVMRPGATLQLGGNSVTFRDIGGSGGGYGIQNAAAGATTLSVLSAASSTFGGTITDGTGGGALSLVKRGGQTLTLNTGNSNYSGSTLIERGALVLNTSARLTSSGTDGSNAITVQGGGILRLTNNTSGANTDRLRNTATITLNSGTFDFDNVATGGTNYAETTGPLVLAGGANTVTSDQAAGGSSPNTTTVTFASLARTAGSQATVNFTSQSNGTSNTSIGVDARNRIVFGTTAPTLNDGIIGGWAFINGTDFATYNTTGIVSVAVAATTADAETAWDTTKNVKPTGSVVLTDNRTVNSLNFASGQSLDLGGKTLNVDSGGLIHQTAVATDTISNGTLTAGTAAGADLVIRTSAAAGTLTVSSIIANNAAGAVGLVKSGPGKLVLTGNNTYSGPTSINGTLSIASDSALGAVPAAATPGNIRIVDGGVLEITNTMTLNANRGLEIGGASPTISVTSGNALAYNGAIAVTGGTASTDLSILGNVDFGGNANTIGGGLNIASNLVTGQAPNSSLVTFATTSGALAIGSNAPGIADLNIAYRTQVPSPDSGGNVGTLDLTALTSFNANLANLRLGVITAGSTATAKGELILPATSTLSVGSGVVIGDSTAAGNSPVQSALTFGSGTSTLTTTSIIAGGRKGNGFVTVATGGTVNLNGFAPNSADLLVAYNNIDNTGVTSTGLADFTAGTLNADLDEIVVGFKTGSTGNSGGANGTLNLGPTNNNIVANQIRLGDYSGTSTGFVSGAMNVGGGSVVVKNDLALGLYAGNGTAGSADGTLNINGGSVVVGGNVVTSNSDRSSGTLNLDGGSLDMTGGSINVDSFNARTGILSNVGQIFNGDGVTAAALTKSGTGALELKGTNTFTGGANISEGSLYVSGSLVTGPVSAATGTTFGGDVVVNGALSLADNSTLKMELGGLQPGTGYDQINMASATGSVTLGSNVQLSLSLGFTPNTSVDTFYFILNRADAGTYTTKFAGLAEGSYVNLGNGIVGQITYNANWTGNAATSSLTGGNDVAITIPEPGTVVSLLGGVGALLGLSRFRRRAYRG